VKICGPASAHDANPVEDDMRITDENMKRSDEAIEEHQRWCEERNARRIRQMQNNLARSHFQRRTVWLMLRDTARRR